jgi:heat shock protein HslJ
MTPDQLDGDWLLAEIDGEQVDPEAPRQVRFDGGRVSGRVGVNRFNGSFTLAEDSIEFGPAAATRMAGPPELMDLESQFYQALEGRHTLRIETRLVIGDLFLILQPDDEPGQATGD